MPPSSFGNRAAVVVTTLGWVALLTLLVVGNTLAQDPTSSPLVPVTDTRSDFLPPGLIGSPISAALLVIGLGTLAALATAAYVRLARR